MMKPYPILITFNTSIFILIYQQSKAINSHCIINLRYKIKRNLKKNDKIFITFVAFLIEIDISLSKKLLRANKMEIENEMA